jgi:hypothetical protein
MKTTGAAAALHAPSRRYWLEERRMETLERHLAVGGRRAGGMVQSVYWVFVPFGASGRTYLYYCKSHSARHTQTPSPSSYLINRLLDQCISASANASVARRATKPRHFFPALTHISRSTVGGPSAARYSRRILWPVKCWVSRRVPLSKEAARRLSFLLIRALFKGTAAPREGRSLILAGDVGRFQSPAADYEAH